jgi:hypothetical protein
MAALVAILTVVVALLTLLVAGLLRSHAEILRRLHALDPDGTAGTAGGVEPTIAMSAMRTGRTAPDLAGAGLRDDVVHVAVAGRPTRTLIAFLSSGCLTCQTFWDAFRNVDALDLPDDVRIVVATKDRDEESDSALRTLAAPDLPLVMSTAAWIEYEVPGSPYFVLVHGATGRVEGEGTGANWPQVRNLIVQAAADGHGRDAREARIDRELLAHGIGPGDPALSPQSNEQ